MSTVVCREPDEEIRGGAGGGGVSIGVERRRRRRKREEGRKQMKAARMPTHIKEAELPDGALLPEPRIAAAHSTTQSRAPPTPSKKKTRDSAPLSPCPRIRGDALDAAGLDADFALGRGGEGEGAAPEEDGEEEERRELGTRLKEEGQGKRRRMHVTARSVAGLRRDRPGASARRTVEDRAPFVRLHQTLSSGGERRPTDRSLKYAQYSWDIHAPVCVSRCGRRGAHARYKAILAPPGHNRGAPVLVSRTQKTAAHMTQQSCHRAPQAYRRRAREPNIARLSGPGVGGPNSTTIQPSSKEGLIGVVLRIPTCFNYSGAPGRAHPPGRRATYNRATQPILRAVILGLGSS
ncbi:hypothetical protein B0H17DRAFT_1144857 [Mycena rosella]|uniref:Uncharacterized protein n=1 Tax=Mycena rosella TaxID=1033263 RepID=A0AAD7G6K2_MYCRO|nr:hypothetical protein B0H17DRAFT_1144857 [Mycena rosella]